MQNPYFQIGASHFRKLSTALEFELFESDTSKTKIIK